MLSYNDMITVTEQSDSFYKQEIVSNGKTYHLFNYRLASSSDFAIKNAREARGVMFNVTDPENPVLVTRSPEKFFNWMENQHSTFNWSDVDILSVMDKMDGTMINLSVDVDGVILIKTKMSFASQFVDPVKHVLSQPKNSIFLLKIVEYVDAGWTINCEYVSRSNMIVVKYDQPDVRVFSMRNNVTGEYLFGQAVIDIFGADHCVKVLETDNIEQYVQDIINSTDDSIEGIVVAYTRNNQLGFVKVKTKQYLLRHSIKGSITDGDTNLYESIVNETIDDTKAYFAEIGDTYVLQLIDSYEQMIIPKANKILSDLTQFYEANKELSRKDYAIKAKNEFGELMPLAMELYLGRLDFKGWMLKNKKLFVV